MRQVLFLPSWGVGGVARHTRDISKSVEICCHTMQPDSGHSNGVTLNLRAGPTAHMKSSADNTHIETDPLALESSTLHRYLAASRCFPIILCLGIWVHHTIWVMPLSMPTITFVQERISQKAGDVGGDRSFVALKRCDL